MPSGGLERRSRAASKCNQEHARCRHPPCLVSSRLVSSRLVDAHSEPTGERGDGEFERASGRGRDSAHGRTTRGSGQPSGSNLERREFGAAIWHTHACHTAHAPPEKSTAIDGVLEWTIRMAHAEESAGSGSVCGEYAAAGGNGGCTG